MSDVKWIKITVSMFDDEKIKIIQAMPESDAILVIWVRLLTLAGKCNAGGYIYFTDSIPYTDEMLATIFNKPVSIIRLAIETFKQFGMVEIDEKGIYLVNWEKHQNIDGLEKIREQSKLSSKRYREKQKLLSDVTVTSRDQTDIDIEEDKNRKELDKKIKYAESVTLTEKEYSSLLEKLGQAKTDRAIEILDNYKGANGKKYKSDYKAILNWVIDRVNKEMPQVRGTQTDDTPNTFTYGGVDIDI